MKSIRMWACGAAAVLLAIGVFVWMSCGSSPATGYKVNPEEKESPERFTEFLENCTLEERIALMQSLRGLQQKIGTDCYGKLDGLSVRGRLDGVSPVPDSSEAGLPPDGQTRI